MNTPTTDFQLPTDRYSPKEQAEFEKLDDDERTAFLIRLSWWITPIVADAWKYKREDKATSQYVAEQTRNSLMKTFK
jgi:hypothetical protein